MRLEPSDSGASIPLLLRATWFALRTACQITIESHHRRAWFRAMAALLAIAASGPIFAQAPPAAPRFVVVLDAAHGGDDAGARLGSEAEKAYTLALSIRLRSLLMARGFAVVTTRESDATLEPDSRAQIANRANAQACISLHAAESGFECTFSSLRWLRSEMRAFSPGRPRRQRGSCAACLLPEWSTRRCPTPQCLSLWDALHCLRSTA